MAWLDETLVYNLSVQREPRKKTGILAPDGRMIWRAPERVGFVKEKSRYCVEAREYADPDEED